MRKCRVCPEHESLKGARLYDRGGSAKYICLCQKHERELFLKGQLKFMKRYNLDLESYDMPDEVNAVASGE